MSKTVMGDYTGFQVRKAVTNSGLLHYSMQGQGPCLDSRKPYMKDLTVVATDINFNIN